MDESLDIRGGAYTETERELDKKLRPLQFKDFRGQKKIVENLEIFVKAAKMISFIADRTVICLAAFFGFYINQ